MKKRTANTNIQKDKLQRDQMATLLYQYLAIYKFEKFTKKHLNSFKILRNTKFIISKNCQNV